MKNQKGISSLIGIVIVLVVTLVAFGGVFAYQYYASPKEEIETPEETGAPTGEESNLPEKGQYIKVLSPNGGEVLEVGKTYDITWEANGIKKIFYIGIKTSNLPELPSEISQNYEIIKNISSESGKYSWTIPTDFAFQKYNKINITAEPIENIGGPLLDWSDNYFTISGKQQTIQKIWPDENSFDFTNKTFEAWIWGLNLTQKVKVLTTDSTEFYSTADIPGHRVDFTFSEVHSKLNNFAGPWPFTVKGTLEGNGVIKADEIFWVVQ